MSPGSQTDSTGSRWLTRFPFLAVLKAFANGVNPRWGTSTVVVSYRTGHVLRTEDRVKRRAKVYVGGKPERAKRARIYL